MPGLDHLLGLPTIADRPARCRNTGAQGLIANGLPRPHLGDQRVLGHHRVTMLQQIGKHMQDFRSQRHASPVLTELIALGVEGIGAKAVAHEGLLAGMIRGGAVSHGSI